MGAHGFSRMSDAEKLRANGILAPWRVSRKQKAGALLKRQPALCPTRRSLVRPREEIELYRVRRGAWQFGLGNLGGYITVRKRSSPVSSYLAYASVPGSGSARI
jgi:hypothetical protein